jgi:hypothetical protein
LQTYIVLTRSRRVGPSHLLKGKAKEPLIFRHFFVEYFYPFNGQMYGVQSALEPAAETLKFDGGAMALQWR